MTIEKERLLNYHQKEMDKFAFSIVLHTLYDTTNNYRLDTLLVWLNNFNEYEADLWAAGERFFSGDTIGAIGILNSASNKYSLTTPQQNDLNNYKAIFNILSGKRLFSLDSSTIQIIKNYDNMGGYAEVLAQNILTLYGYFYPPVYDLPAVERNDFTSSKVKKDCITSIIPNPVTTSNAFIEVNAHTEGGDLVFQIFDTNGRLIDYFSNLPSNSSFTWNSGDLKPGIYFYKILVENKVCDTGKIVVVK